MPRPDYDKLIDPEMRAFIEETEAHYRDARADEGIAMQRARYDAMCAAMRAPRPAGVNTADITLDGVPCRHYHTAAPAPAPVGVLYLHGGGFVLGGLESHDDICAEIADKTGLPLIAVDYRLAPEHPHPAAFDDALRAARAAARNWTGMVLAGDSAGACLAAAIAQPGHVPRGVKGQVLIYPGLGGDPDRGSYIEHADAPLLSRADVLAYAGLRYGEGEEPADDATATPLWAPSFAGLPPSVVFSAECDPLRDDGRAYCALIDAAGGRAGWLCEAGMVHGYLRARHRAARAKAAFERITGAISALARDAWPAGIV